MGIKNLAADGNIRYLAVIAVILKGTHAQTEQAANLLTGEVNSFPIAERCESIKISMVWIAWMILRCSSLNSLPGDAIFVHGSIQLLSGPFPEDGGHPFPAILLCYRWPYRV